MTPPREEDLERLHDALEDARRTRLWPSTMALPDAVDELRLWLADDRQWATARANHWKSLVAPIARRRL